MLHLNLTPHEVYMLILSQRKRTYTSLREAEAGEDLIQKLEHHLLLYDTMGGPGRECQAKQNEGLML